MQTGHEPKQAYRPRASVECRIDRVVVRAPAFLPPTDAPCRKAGAFVFQLKEVHHV